MRCATSPALAAPVVEEVVLLVVPLLAGSSLLLLFFLLLPSRWREERSFDLDLCFLERCFFFFSFLAVGDVVSGSLSPPNISSINDVAPVPVLCWFLVPVREGAPPRDKELLLEVGLEEASEGALERKDIVW